MLTLKGSRAASRKFAARKGRSEEGRRGEERGAQGRRGEERGGEEKRAEKVRRQDKRAEEERGVNKRKENKTGQPADEMREREQLMNQVVKSQSQAWRGGSLARSPRRKRRPPLHSALDIANTNSRRFEVSDVPLFK